jgi:hypothetical protein
MTGCIAIAFAKPTAGQTQQGRFALFGRSMTARGARGESFANPVAGEERGAYSFEKKVGSYLSEKRSSLPRREVDIAAHSDKLIAANAARFRVPLSATVRTTFPTAPSKGSEGPRLRRMALSSCRGRTEKLHECTAVRAPDRGWSSGRSMMRGSL